MGTGLNPATTDTAAAGAARSPGFRPTRTDGSGNELVLCRVTLVPSEIDLEADGFECLEEGEVAEDEAEDEHESADDADDDGGGDAS